MLHEAYDSRLAALLDQVDRAEVIGLAQTLVRIPSITGQEGLAISNTMAGWLRDAGIEAGLQMVGDQRANVWGRVQGGSGPRVLLNGHLDTKPGDHMVIDPFGGEIQDGRLYGRGSCDMKGPIAAMMLATKLIAQAGLDLRGTLIFGSEVGEDGGGWKIEELLDGPGACDIGICGEPTKLELHLGCRGVLPLRVRTIGLATHTGTADQGINAIQKMCQVIPALYALPIFQRVDPRWGRSPVNAMVISGGGKVTASVPDECVVLFDIRLNPDLPPDEAWAVVEAELARLQARDPELRIDAQIGYQMGSSRRASAPASHIPPTDPLVRRVADSVEAATGRRPALAGFPGGCSAAPMLRRGIRSVIFGPGNLEQAHSVDEWIDLDQLYQATRAYVAIAYRLLVSPA